MVAPENLTPVLLLGGGGNVLSAVRSLSKFKIAVAVSGDLDSPAMHSRYTWLRFPIPPGQDAASYWHELLLGNAQPRLQGALLIPCGDDAISFVSEHYEALSSIFLMDGNDPHQRLDFLNKQRTLEQAAALEIPIPRFWRLKSMEDLDAIQDQLIFPVIIKPHLSHVFQQHFAGKRYLKFERLEDLVEGLGSTLDLGLSVMISEFIDGPDSLACSYYTYRTADGDHLFHYTKRVMRRFPKNHGGGSYHLTEWLPEVAELGQKFFDGVGLKGLGNIEFKRDRRDNKLKVIEVNARLTAAHELITESGLDISHIIYCHRTGTELPHIPPPVELKKNALWSPFKDIRAFRELRRNGELTFGGWIRSVARRQNFQVWRLSDPLPGCRNLYRIELRPLFRKARGIIGLQTGNK